MRLAYFSPLPPTPSGIADYSNELLPHLAERAEISLFVDQPESLTANLRDQFAVGHLSEYPDKRWSFDLALYHMGNNVHHQAIYNYALRYPGIVVLHDLFLHHFIGSITFVKDDHSSYARELGYAAGSGGLDLFSDIRLGRRKFPVFELPLCNRLVDRSLGIIVHSQDAAAKIQNMRPERPAQIIPHFVFSHEGRSYRQDLGLSEDTVIFASLGFVNTTKQIEFALRAFARLRQSVPDIYYLIAGGVLGDIDLQNTINELGLNEVVMHTGYVPDLQTFINWTATADVVINLRYPTLGETSGAALRAMASGKPLVVFDHGWYAELPEDVCIKVPPMDAEALQSAMQELAQKSDLRARIGQNALRSAKRDHDPGLVAEKYLAFLRAYLRAIDRRRQLWSQAY